MNRPFTLELDARHFEALQQLSAKLHLPPEEVLRTSLRLYNSLLVRQLGVPVFDTYADLPGLPSQDLAVIPGETTPFSSKEDYYKFQTERVFGFIRDSVVRLDPAAEHWVDAFQERLLLPAFRAKLNPEWLNIRMSLDRRLTYADDNLTKRGCRAGFAQLMRPYTDPRVMPWVNECGLTIVKFVEAYMNGHLPGQTIQTPDTAMASMIRELWATSLVAVRFD